MPEPNQEKKEEESKFNFLKVSEWPEHIWNFFWRLPGLKRLRVGRKRVGTRRPLIFYYLNKTWFPINNGLFGDKLKTVEDFWKEQGNYYGDGKDEEGEPSLLGNPTGIVRDYTELGAYFDVDRIHIEIDFFKVGTGYIEENIEYGIPKEPAVLEGFGWKEDKVKEVLGSPGLLRSFPLLKVVRLTSGIVYNEGKKELREELYCFGFPNAEALARRINLYNARMNVQELQRLGAPIAVRNAATETATALTELINTIAGIEKETYLELNSLKGIAEKYYEKWSYQAGKISPEGKKVGVIRYPHTYRIIKQILYEEIVEDIAIRGRVVREVIGEEAAEGFRGEKLAIEVFGEILTKQSLKRKVIIKSKQEKNIYEEEEEQLTQEIKGLKKSIDEIKKFIEKRGVSEKEEQEYLSKIKGYEERIKIYEQRLEDIRNNILNKNEIISKTTPQIAPNEFWKRPEEIDYGLDENGYPLEIDPNTGEVLIDRWWSEIAQNGWQLRKIASKPGGADVLKKHLGVEVKYYEGKGEEDDEDKDEIKVRGKIIGTPSREIRYVKDKRFHGYVDLLELGAIIYSGWDAFRDDLRDGRYHRHSKSAADYVIEGEGGFDEERAAPYPKAWLQALGGIGRTAGGYMKRTGIIPMKPIGTYVNVHDKDTLIKATPAWFEKNLPSDEKDVTREYRMRMPDGSFIQGKRIPTKYNPAFDRRAANLDYVYWGRMYYYRWSGYINEWDENPFPHISTRGIALYIDHLVKSDVYRYEDAENALQKQQFDYGVRGMTMYGYVNPAEGTGILQEN